MSKIWIEHPDLGPEQRSLVDRKAFELAWINSGWVETDGPYDPSTHTVSEVLEHLEEHPEHKEEVLKAEKEGKARSTLTKELEE